MTKFSIKHDDTIAYYDKAQKWEGVIGMLYTNDEGDMDINLPVQIPWQYRDFNSLYMGKYSDELPPHRSFDHAIMMVEGNEPP